MKHSLCLFLFFPFIFTGCTMTDTPSENDHIPFIKHPRFQLAVELLDQGNADELRKLLRAEPELLTHRAAEDGSRVGAYFAHPYLLWFIAENPTRNETLPENIVDITEILIEEASRHKVAQLPEQMNYALSLVASGRVPREEGKQQALIEVLCKHGADPNAAMNAALAEGEEDAVKALVHQGAKKSLPVLAFYGEKNAIKTRLQTGEELSDQEKNIALMVAAMRGHASVIFVLCSNDYGKLDPTAYGPEGFHSHSTPLHQAGYQGHREAVGELMKMGADPAAKDTLWGGTPRDWAEYGGHADLAEFINDITPLTTLTHAALAGDLETLASLLDENPEQVHDWMPLYGGRLLDVVCNLNYPRTNPGNTIRFLIERGANPNLGAQPDGSGESPLHAAASDGDESLAMEVIDALLEGGADINRLGGVITGGTPLHNATIFQLREIGAHLLKHGAACDLFLAAGNGRLDLIKTMFTPQGTLKDDAPRVPGYQPEEAAQDRINWAFFIAAEAGEVPVLEFLHPKETEHVTLPDGTSALDRATFRGHHHAVEWLKQKGVPLVE